MFDFTILKKNTFLYILVVCGLISLFATCKNNPTEVVTEAVIDDDTAEIVFKEIEEFMDPVPSKISLAAEAYYPFTRNRNFYEQNYFRNPFDSGIYVSGTFCELRGNHFHAGLDIRTGGQEGWPVLSAADGYIERVKVNTEGYGRVVYIRHTNGFTTVYGHLKEFTGELANYVNTAQYAQRKFEIELYPKKGELNVKKGQQFALSGNTGGSGGPHLHFEIRDPKGRSTNPLLHGLTVADNIKPEIKNISVYLKSAESLYSTGNYPYITLGRNSEYLKRTKTLNLKPGTYSFGMRTDDYFTDRNNRLGINYCWLTANGELLYQYQIEKFDFDQGRYIYTHTDPFLAFRTGLTYVRLFKEKYNPLPYYTQNQNAELWIKQGDSVQCKLYIQDYAGLTDSISWIVVGDTNGQKLGISNTANYDHLERVESNKSTLVKYGNWQVSIPAEAVYHPFDIRLSEQSSKQGMLSKTLQMHYGYTPLHTYIYVTYTVPPEWLKYGNKLCAISFDGRRDYEGGVLDGNKLTFKTRYFGQYAIAVDNQAPVIKPLSTGVNFKFRVSDNLSEISQIICSIDGKWILAEYEPKTNLVWGEIPKWIEGGSHDFKLIVIDGRGNRAEYAKNITLP